MSVLSLSDYVSEVITTNILSEPAPQNGRKTAGIDMVGRSYVTVTICVNYIYHHTGHFEVFSIATTLFIEVTVFAVAGLWEKTKLRTLSKCNTGSLPFEPFCQQTVKCHKKELTRIHYF